jgi:hypothetical protein
MTLGERAMKQALTFVAVGDGQSALISDDPHARTFDVTADFTPFKVSF